MCFLIVIYIYSTYSSITICIYIDYIHGVWIKTHTFSQKVPAARQVSASWIFKRLYIPFLMLPADRIPDQKFAVWMWFRPTKRSWVQRGFLKALKLGQKRWDYRNGNHKSKEVHIYVDRWKWKGQKCSRHEDEQGFRCFQISRLRFGTLSYGRRITPQTSVVLIRGLTALRIALQHHSAPGTQL